MNPNNALIKRTIDDNGDGETVTITEEWDLTSPDCPFIRPHWLPPLIPKPTNLTAIYRDVPRGE